MLLSRRFSLNPQKNFLLLGPRRVGKSTFLKSHALPLAHIDLLMNHGNGAKPWQL